MKKIIGFLSVCLIMVFSFGCDNNTEAIIPKNTLDFDLTNLSTENQIKYDELADIFKNVNEDSILAFGTTSTANIFDDLGLNVNAAPASPSLNKNLTQNQVTAAKYTGKDKQVLNLGSALDINNEAVLKLKPEYFFYSDAMNAMAGQSYKTLIDAGIKVVGIPQTNYEDIFMLLDVLQKQGFKNEKLDNVIKEFKDDLTEIKNKIDGKQPKEIAVLQVAGGKIMSIGSDGMVSQVATSLGIKNIFANQKSGDLNKEQLIEMDPQVIFHYTHSMTADTKTGFENLIDQYQLNNITAIKNNLAVQLGNTEYVFSPSVDLTITKLMKQLVEYSYE